MNYIAEINAFYAWQVQNPISANAQALWHRLMSYCNAFNWADDFTITNGRLVEDLGISRQELDRVRNVLCQKGIIEYEKGNGNQCGTYKIISFASQETPNPVTQTGHNADASAAQVDTQSGPLYKHKLNVNESKKENKKEKSAYFDNPELDALFCEYLALRKKIRAVNSERAVKMLLTELDKYDDAVKTAMLNKSIVNSWKTVYPLKEHELSAVNSKAGSSPNWN